mgnify:CR=1 FL=1
MIAHDTLELAICSDCYMYYHDTDSLGSDYLTPEMAHDIRQGFDRLGDVIMGDTHGEDCDDPEDWEDCNCNETHFSWSPCGICASYLGGNRHDVDIIQIKRN